MKTLDFAIVFSTAFLLSASVACRTIREASSLVATERHADSVAVLRSIAATAIATESERETVVVTMRPDTITGELRIVAKDITKTIIRNIATETAKRADTTVFEAKAKQTDTRTEKTRESESNAAKAYHAGFIAAVWGCFTLLAAALVLYIHAKWKSRN